MPSLAYFVLFAALIAGFFLIFSWRREREKELYRIDKLRVSRLYRDMSPLVQRASCRDLDQVCIERGRIIFTQVYPAGTLGIYDLRQSGHWMMSRQRTRVLTELLAQDLIVLQDRRKYTLRRYRVLRPNGSVDYAYVYTIKTRYKESILAIHRRMEERI